MLSTSQITYIRTGQPKADQKILRIFNVLGERNRLDIFCLIAEHHDLCVSDVATILDTSISAASQQLKIMEYSGLVSRMRMGKSVCYKVNTEDPFILRVIGLLKYNDGSNI